MKIIFKMTTFVMIISLGQCTVMTCENDLSPEKEVLDSDLLYFSFNKENFNDFRCNLSNSTLSHSSIYKPPFYESESVRNFLSTLSLFFQYAEIKNNIKFKKHIEVLFKIYSIKMHSIRNDLTEYTYDPQTFKDRMLKLDATIESILEEQDPTKQIVTVEDQGDRIIITQKIVSKNLYFKIVDEGIKEFSKEYLDDEVLVAGYELFIKLYEMYLQGLLGNNFKKALEAINSNYIELSSIKRTLNSSTQNPSSTSEKGIYELMLRFDQVLDSPSSKSKVFNCHPCDHELSEKEIADLKKQTIDLVLRQLTSGDVPEYYYELVFKFKSKTIWTISEGLTDDFDGYTGSHPNNVKIMIDLKGMLEEYLQKSEKIFFYHELSQESINNLVRICLELVL